MPNDDEWPFGTALKRARGKRSIRSVAALAGISEGRWRQLEAGYQATGGVRIPARPKPDTVVAVAGAVGLDEREALVAAGYDPSEYEALIPERSGSRHLGHLTVAVPDLQNVPDEALLDEVRRRMADNAGRPATKVIQLRPEEKAAVVEQIREEVGRWLEQGAAFMDPGAQRPGDVAAADAAHAAAEESQE